MDSSALNNGNDSSASIEIQSKHEEYKAEYEKIQEDINTLKMVLNEKLKREQELKNLLGISFADELKHDFQEGINQIKQLTAFQKTAETFSTIGAAVTHNDAIQKTTASIKSATDRIAPTFETLGTTIRAKFGDMKNSNVFKSFEATFNTSKMKGSKSEFIIDESNTHSTANASASFSNGNIAKESIKEEK